jgi:glycosyltransferase involved in cell wall biosynthesis
MFQLFRNQDYPKELIEWIIVDDGTDKIRDLVEESNIPQIRYYELPEKISLGAKRNLMHSYCRPESEIIIYMDDDDYYPPDRFSHAVETLMNHPECLIAGASEMHIVFKGLKYDDPNSVHVYQAGPYGENHATAGTFAFRRALLNDHRYEDDAALAEETRFLNGFKVPMAQLDPRKTILVFSHNHNTFDKRKMLENIHPLYFKESPDKTVESFIARPHEAAIKRFFLKDIDDLLASYDPGRPDNKPDVVVQMREIERKKRELEMQQTAIRSSANASIVITLPDGSKKSLTTNECANMLQEQNRLIHQFMRKTHELVLRCQQLESQLRASPNGQGNESSSSGAEPETGNDIPPLMMHLADQYTMASISTQPIKPIKQSSPYKVYDNHASMALPITQTKKPTPI